MGAEIGPKGHKRRRRAVGQIGANYIYLLRITIHHSPDCALHALTPRAKVASANPIATRPKIYHSGEKRARRNQSNKTETFFTLLEAAEQEMRPPCALRADFWPPPPPERERCTRNAFLFFQHTHAKCVWSLGRRWRPPFALMAKGDFSSFNFYSTRLRMILFARKRERDLL